MSVKPAIFLAGRILAFVTDSGEIGRRVREARKRRGLTQTELAAASGLSASLVTKLESGALPGLRLETVRKLAVALGEATSALMSQDAPGPAAGVGARWEPVQRALDGVAPGQPSGEPTADGVRSALAGVVAMGDASDPLTAMPVVEERCWGLIRQGRLSEARELAFRWADLAEPRTTAAGREQWSAWGRLLMRASSAVAAAASTSPATPC